MTAREHGLPTLLADLSAHWSDTQRQLLALARALPVNGIFSPRVCCPEDTPLAAAAREAGLTPLLLPRRRPDSPPGSLRSLFRLWREQQKKRPLLFHSFSEDALHLGSWLARLRRAENTLRIHSRGTPLPAAPHPREAALWRQTDSILCASDVIRNGLADAGVPPGQLGVAHPALEMRELPQRAQRHDGRFVFLVLEPLEEGCGVDVLLKAMTALWQRHDLPPWEVRVAGQGALFGALLDEARGLGVAARLSLLGRQPLEDVLPLGDALLSPRVAPHGNWRALAGAWACGLPLVCTAVPGNRELMGRGDVALVTPPGDAQALAAAMIRLMREPRLCEQLAAQGRGMRPHMDMARMTRQYEEAYVRCAQHKGWALPTGGTPSDGASPPQQ